MKTSSSFALILIAGALFYTFINPQYAKVKELRAQAAQYDEVLENVSSLVETRDNLLLKYREMPKSEIDRLTKVLPDNVDTVKLALDFDTIAAKYGISIKSIQTDTNVGQGNSTIIQDGSGRPYAPVTVAFTFVSSYENFRKFMRDIEQSLRIIDVKSIAFQSSGDSSTLYEYKIAIQTYWLK